MTFNPIKTSRRNRETDEMELRPGLVDQNFSLVGLETKKLEENIKVNKNMITNEKRRADENVITFANHLMFL